MIIKNYQIRILKSGEKSFKVYDLGVAVENSKYFILNDPEFTKINKKKAFSSLNNTINVSSISEWKLGFSLDGLHYSLYSNKNKKIETIKREIADWITEHYSYLYQVNLDFIK